MIKFFSRNDHYLNRFYKITIRFAKWTLQTTLVVYILVVLSVFSLLCCGKDYLPQQRQASPEAHIGAEHHEIDVPQETVEV